MLVVVRRREGILAYSPKDQKRVEFETPPWQFNSGCWYPIEAILSHRFKHCIKHWFYPSAQACLSHPDVSGHAPLDGWVESSFNSGTRAAPAAHPDQMSKFFMRAFSTVEPRTPTPVNGIPSPPGSAPSGPTPTAAGGSEQLNSPVVKVSAQTFES